MSTAIVTQTQLTMVITGSAFGKVPTVPITAITDAAVLYRMFIMHQGYGASRAGTCTVMADGKPIARVSYNGRIWDNDGKEIIPS